MFHMFVVAHLLSHISIFFIYLPCNNYRDIVYSNERMHALSQSWGSLHYITDIKLINNVYICKYDVIQQTISAAAAPSIIMEHSSIASVLHTDSISNVHI